MISNWRRKRKTGDADQFSFADPNIETSVDSDFLQSYLRFVELLQSQILVVIIEATGEQNIWPE